MRPKRTPPPLPHPWRGSATRLGVLLGATWLGVSLLANGCTSAAPSTVALERILPDEPLERPVALAPLPDGSGDLVVVEQRGIVKRFAPGAATATVFLDLAARVSASGNEEGLLGIAIHPRFAENRAFFVYYSAAGPRRSVLSRFQADGPGGTADPGGERVLLEVPQPYSNHNGGQIAFGPDGMLYVALGDGGAGGDPHGHGQNRATLLGSILRLDVDGSAPGLAYGIPADNPFVGAADGSRPEIWAYGLRNPWRFSFDRETGALYAGDVGQNEVEEVDRIVRGGNYGWNAMEGSRCYQPAQGCPRAGLELPIAEYPHGQGRSITGGYVYRGAALPALRGRYLFADYVEGRVWSIPAQGAGPHAPQPLLATGLYVSAFGEDAAGELYVLDHGNGRIYRLVPAR
jgi:glucose/arabinose dehydrogenase